MNMRKDINKLNRKELINLAMDLINERDYRSNPINKVSVCDVEVESNVESLNKCKHVVNELIKKNKNFITNRRNKLKIDEMGYLG